MQSSPGYEREREREIRNRTGQIQCTLGPGREPIYNLFILQAGEMDTGSAADVEGREAR